MEPLNIKEYLYGLQETLFGIYENAFGCDYEHYLKDKNEAEQFFHTTYRILDGTIRQAVAVLGTICDAMTNGDIDIVDPEDATKTAATR